MPNLRLQTMLIISSLCFIRYYAGIYIPKILVIREGYSYELAERYVENLADYFQNQSSGFMSHGTISNHYIWSSNMVAEGIASQNHKKTYIHIQNDKYNHESKSSSPSFSLEALLSLLSLHITMESRINYVPYFVYNESIATNLCLYG